jgi:PAS domain S-box-containing protein
MNEPFDADANYHMRLAVDSVPSMLAYWDRDLHCRFANRAYERWFGVDPQALIGTSIRDLLGPKLFALNEPYILGALRGEPQLFERIVPGPDGVNRHALARYIPDVVDGKVLGFVAEVTEVTKLKETEAALAREQLRRVQTERHARELDTLLRERSEMLDVLAHEVRQPLNNASAALQAIESALGDRDTVAAVKLARAQAVMARVNERIDNTLAVASLLAGAEPIARQDSDVDALICVAVGDMPSGDRERIDIERLTTTRTASMDMGLMRLALRNLLSNALRYVPPASRVKVRVSDSDDPLGLVIEVVDKGPGVDPKVIPRLFERGVRGEAPEGTRGHGLGLFIVRRVMELHGGRVELAHNGPDGATFRLLLVQPTNE